MALTGMDNGHAGRARRREYTGRRCQPRPRQRQVIPHGVDISAGAAEVDLPVDAQHRGVFGVHGTVERPRIRLRIDLSRHTTTPC